MTLTLTNTCGPTPNHPGCTGHGPGWRCTCTCHTTPRHRATDVAEAAGITYRQLDHWARNGHIHLPNTAPGSGNYRLLSDTDAAIVGWVGALVTDGVTPARAGELARDLWTVGHARLAGCHITRESQ